MAEQLGGLLSAVVNRRFDEAGMRIFALAQGDCPDVAGFALEVQSLVGGDLDLTIGELNVARTISDLLSLAARHGLDLPEELVAFFKQLVYLDGICRALAPGYDLLGDGGQVVEAARQRSFAACAPVTRRRRPAADHVRLGGARLALSA